MKYFIKIAHADPYVSSLPMIELSKTEFIDEISRRIFVFERASQFELLSKNEETFMWVSPIPHDVLERYNLVQVECADTAKIYKDLLMYRSNYRLSDLDKDFITRLSESKRSLLIKK